MSKCQNVKQGRLEIQTMFYIQEPKDTEIHLSKAEYTN